MTTHQFIERKLHVAACLVKTALQPTFFSKLEANVIVCLGEGIIFVVQIIKGNKDF